MSTSTTKQGAASAVSGTRHRSADESRKQLLTAAAELFSDRGYEGTTVREIGRQANVDPTLIARYFGSKAALYLEALRIGAPSLQDSPPDLTTAGALFEVLERVQRNGLAPTLEAAIRPHGDAELQSAAMSMLNQRVTAPMEARAAERGDDEARLRAEIVTAALAGVMISRISKALPTLDEATPERVATLIAELIGPFINN